MSATEYVNETASERASVYVDDDQYRSTLLNAIGSIEEDRERTPMMVAVDVRIYRCAGTATMFLPSSISPSS